MEDSIEFGNNLTYEHDFAIQNYKLMRHAFIMHEMFTKFARPV